MKKLLLPIFVVLMLGMMAVIPATPALAASPTITLLNELPTELQVGESYTIDILVESDEPFTLAIALPDQYYPGRYIDYTGSDRANRASSAVLHLTMTGKAPTAELPDGVNPAAVVVGVRYKGTLVSERFDFDIAVY
jgi:hypothetical protein